MRFADIPGLIDIKKDLFRNVESGRVAHAQLFMGKPGSANLTLALAYATLLNCEQPENRDACGHCRSCQKSNKFIHPDTHFVFPVSPIKSISGKDVVSNSFIAPWREFLTQNPYGGPIEWSTCYGGEDKQLNISKEESRNIIRSLSLKAFEGPYKVMIIWLPEYLHPAAANAILKILEEPPEKTVFLLVTNDYEQLLSTILSRTLLIRIRSFRNEEIQSYLTEHQGIEEAKAAHWAHIATGDMNEAIRLATEMEDDSHSMFREWMRNCWAGTYNSLIEMADRFNKMKKIEKKSLLQYGLNIMQSSLVQGYFDISEIAIPDGRAQQFIEKFSKVLNIDTIDLISLELNKAYYHLERNANPRILFLDTSILISGIFKKARS